MTRLEFRTFKRLDKIAYKLNVFGVFIMLMRLFKRDKDLYFKYTDWVRYRRKMCKEKEILKKYLPTTTKITPIMTSTLMMNRPTNHSQRIAILKMSDSVHAEYDKYKKRIEEEG